MNKKEEILDEAAKLFGKKGYAFALSELAEAVGIKTPSLYSHFKSKDNIVELMLEREIRRFRGALEDFCSKMPDAGGRRRLEDLFRFVLEYMADMDGFWKGMVMIENTELRKKCLGMVLSQNGWFTKVLEGAISEGIAEGDVSPDAGTGAIYLYYSTILGLTDIILLSKGTDFDMTEYANMTWAAYWNSIRSGREGKAS